MVSETKVLPLDLANLDTTCAPCDDFNQFANGGWISRNPIPQEYARWASFDELKDRNATLLHSILDSLVQNKSKVEEAVFKQLGAFYASCMDTAQIETYGASPIYEELSAIDSIANAAHVREYIASSHAKGSSVLFAHRAAPDYKNSSDIILEIRQGGLGLPDRDYYLKTDTASQSIRTDYRAHIARMLALSGQSPESAIVDAGEVLNLETSLAKVSMSRVERRDPNRTYNRVGISELRALTPDFDWHSYLKYQSIPESTPVNVAQLNFLKAANALINSVSIDTWKAYFRWNLVNSAAPYLSSDFVDENFYFFQRRLAGNTVQLPRYKQCAQVADRLMGDAVGQLYVAQHFPPRAKDRALEMVHNLKEAFRDRLATRKWMSDSTREQAYKKLDALNVKVGYPDKWKDYSSLVIDEDKDYFSNVSAALVFRLHDDLSQIGKPVDRTRWSMTPPTVNAYYNPSKNEIVFPAGILQPPFFDADGEDAVNYGGMGSIIGHEISHGFDDYGSRFDENGNLRNWFTERDLNNFKSQTKLVEEQFSSYFILDSLFINGKLTLGENIADLGGVTVAYHAFQKTAAGKSTDRIDGFTPQQRFFLGWAQVWRGSMRDELARERIITDPHSPLDWRTNGSLANLAEFATAWGCKEGDRMVRSPEKRAEIW